MTRYLGLISILLFSGQSMGAENVFYLGPQAGLAEISIHEKFLLSEDNFEDDNFEVGIAAGYRFANQIVLESTYTASDSADVFDLGDTYNLNQFQLHLGYAWQMTENIRFVPKAGLSFWKFDGEEGQLFNPGAEERLKSSGTDFNWSLNFEVPMSKLMVLNLSYADNSFEFGDTQSFAVALRFEF